MSAFLLTLAKTRHLVLIHKFYIAASTFLIIWLFALIGVRYTSPENINMLMFLDAVTTLGGAFIPPCSLLFVICYTKEYERNLPKPYWSLFIVPILTMILIFTNKYHHLYYKVFSLSNSEVVFGPYFYFYSFYTFACVALSIFTIIMFAIKTKMKLHIWQAVLFTIGSLAPSFFNLLIVTNVIQATIAITPISFIITMIFHGIVIYGLHFFDIKPIAMQQIVNWIADCYLVINQNGLVVTFNHQFIELMGEQYKIRENIHLQDCVKNDDVKNKTNLYNLLTAINSAKQSETKVTYEQSANKIVKGEMIKCFYMVEVTPLIIKGEICGILSIMRDITQVKTNMQKMQDNQVKMMEQERLAFLGQMVGGLAHNLKTPIMSISGSVSAVENLIEECNLSINDPDVTADDYKEIYEEMSTWLERMRESCSYMSDIITAVKGQASNMNGSNVIDFSLEETFKRVILLLRHELLNCHCNLKIEGPIKGGDVMLHGDINNLVQVINNLVSNAIDAQLPNGNHDIIIGIDRNDKFLNVTVKDFGTGISKNVRQKIFQEMVTSKGNKGSGLGVFISNTVIKAKFDGTMWFDDNPNGGTVWGISIPLQNVIFNLREGTEANAKE